MANYVEAIRTCAELLQQQGYVKDTFGDACLAREQKFPTGVPVPRGLAIPHADSIHVLKSCLCLLKLSKSVKFNRIDDPNATVDVSFVVCIAIAQGSNHNAVLAQLIQAFQDENFVNGLSQSSSKETQRLFEVRMAG